MLHKDCPSADFVTEELKEIICSPKFEEWDFPILMNICYAAIGHSGHEARVLSLTLLKHFIDHRKARLKEMGFPSSITGFIFDTIDERFILEGCPSILKLEHTYKIILDYKYDRHSAADIHNLIFRDGFIHHLLGVKFDENHSFVMQSD